MTSISTYQEITPTYLYIKEHSITGLKYFGKTTQTDPYKYLGSGVYWTRHYKKHGKHHIKTLWVSDLYYDTSIVDIALQFSYENNIVESKEWANLEPENGLNGGNPTPESIQKCKDTKKKNGTMNPNTPESIQKGLETKKKNGTMNPTTPESIKKAKDTKKERGTSSDNPDIIQKMLDTKKERGIENPMKNPDIIQKMLDTKKERGIENPSTIPFLSIVVSRKTYAKNKISRMFPELKQYY